MQVVFSQRWRSYNAGDVATLPDGLANALVRFGWATVSEPDECAAIEPERETASVVRRRGKRG